MSRLMHSSFATLRRLWSTQAPLTAVGLLMLPALGLSLAGLWLDPRLITGVPAWLKPAKFAASIAVYSLTLAWIFTRLSAWERTRRVVGTLTAGVFVLEFAVIALQAWRGTTSHFNVATPLDATLFAVMGLAIVAQTLATIAVAVALWRQEFSDRAMGWALRVGLVITLVGASTGGLMTRPTAAQLADARAQGRPLIVGAHTVGAPDGGPGLPGTGWSTQHGDLRVPHFVGLHAIQLLPLVVVVLRRTRLNGERVIRATVVAAASYAMLFAILLWQALRGQSFLAADTATVAAVATWLAATAGAAFVTLLPPSRVSGHAMVS